jgi:hypothetical protein
MPAPHHRTAFESVVAVARLRSSSPIVPAAGRAAGAVSHRGHGTAALVAGLTPAPFGAAAQGGT